MRPSNGHAGVLGAGNTTMAFLAHHFSNIVATDYKTIAIICLLCAFAAYFIKEYLFHPPMIIFVYPVLVPAQFLRIMSSTFLKFIQTTGWTSG